ncbi:hypothetical protein, unlikely [Trypanosoma brucei gambiense DAL972]|uniref:Uncharacterized protein n=1 Tax=Trypanosoma brucei gambiense (strain MHOM/CI/86/DAL972) TaxID=679716 RepID=C9ZT95_TRYB9|nr:hypothetical protein, unlikely [Trypanosoma brucei gambiense DAL972]CBH12630.1 hypothetical protein, unlikely [Trypanosoma brucei gambiense DAL972]|eukprot:XP_011774910.1 hypothetical protein, unlikely [Trypanosoma brucei gambiense DAL972]
MLRLPRATTLNDLRCTWRKRYKRAWLRELGTTLGRSCNKTENNLYTESFIIITIITTVRINGKEGKHFTPFGTNTHTLLQQTLCTHAFVLTTFPASATKYM